MKRFLVVLSFLAVICAAGFLYYTPAQAVLPEAKAQELALAFAKTQSNLAFIPNSAKISDDGNQWIVVLNTDTDSKSMKVYIDVHSGKVVDHEELTG